MSLTAAERAQYITAQIAEAATKAGLRTGHAGDDALVIGADMPTGTYLAVHVEVDTGNVYVGRVLRGGRTAGRIAIIGMPIDMTVDAIVAMGKAL